MAQRAHASQLARRPRLLVAVVATMLAACGTSSASTSTPTATATLVPTATATPTPCTSWQVVASPNPAQSQPVALYGVSAVSPTDVWAVGGSGGNTTAPYQQTVIERWNGNSWSLTSSPPPPADYLHGVAAISASDVWAVGGTLNYGVGPIPYKPLIEHWNGSQWSVVPGGAIAAFVAIELDGAAARASNDVWAVGTVDPSGGAHRPLVEHWNGSAWQATVLPVPTGAAVAQLSAVATVPGSQEVWAVGSSQRYDVPTGQVQPLIEQWDGTSWHSVPAPAALAGTGGTLSGTVALSPTDAWAVGGGLILHWDGVAWQIATSPQAAGNLLSVAAAGARDVRAVGSNTSSKQALIEQWNGSAWQIVAAPTSSGATSSVLRGITSDESGAYWAVGSAQTAAGTSQTLIEHCP